MNIGIGMVIGIGTGIGRICVVTGLDLSFDSISSCKLLIMMFFFA